VSVTPSIVASATDSGNAASLVVAPLTGQLAGDYRELRISISGATITTPSGWSVVSNTLLASTRRIYVFQRVGLAFASEPSTTFSFSGTVFYGAIAFNLRDTNPPDPLDVDPVAQGNSTSQTALVAPDVTPSVTGLGVYSFHQFNQASAPSFTPPGSFTLVASSLVASSTGHAVALYSEVLPAGAAGTRTVTSSQSAAWGACVETYQPVPDPPGIRSRRIGMAALLAR
jgi:hypothetical protein